MPCSLILALSSYYCKEVFCYPEFESFLVKTMVGPSRSMRLDHEEIRDELWKENECSVNSESEFSDDSDCYSVVSVGHEPHIWNHLGYC
jgi:hypothetical protein